MALSGENKINIMFIQTSNGGKNSHRPFSRGVKKKKNMQNFSF
jgi:hypothetical protein